jgi:hypothetical protein
LRANKILTILKSMLKINREKYLLISRDQGYQAAITALHRDTEKWEHQAFEGEQGWAPAMWKDLHEVRVFSRELWDAALGMAPTTSVKS